MAYEKREQEKCYAPFRCKKNDGCDNGCKKNDGCDNGCGTSIIFVLCILLLMLLGNVAEQDSLILSHKDNGSHQHAVLVYIPGFNISASAYRPLVSILQDEFDDYNISLHAAIVRYPKFWGREYPPFLSRDSLVQAALQQIQRALRYNVSYPIFVGGHSLGAIIAQMVAYEHPTVFNGLLIHGGYVMPKYCRDQQALSVPTLTLSGTHDGMNRFTYVAMQYKTLQARYPFHGLSYHTHAPTLLIEGMNHFQVANNAPCSEKHRDLEESISLPAALKLVSKFSVSFMLQQMNITVNDQSSLQHKMELAEERYFQPYIRAVEADESGETCIISQRLHLEDMHVEIVVHQPRSSIGFVLSKPKGNQTRIQVEMHMSKAFTWFGRSSVPQAVQMLRCKMVTKEQIFGETSKEYDSCASMNAYIFQRAFSSLPEDIQRAYLAKGRSLEMRNDIETGGGTQWLSYGLEFTQNGNDTVLLQSPRLKTRAGSGRYSGKLYCALLPMSRALEYILIDSSHK